MRLSRSSTLRKLFQPSQEAPSPVFSSHSIHEALALTSPTTSIAERDGSDQVHQIRSRATVGDLRRPDTTASPTLRPITFVEAVSQLQPDPEHSLEEALASLGPEVSIRETNGSEDSDISIFLDPYDQLNTRLKARKTECIVKEVADFLEADDRRNASRSCLYFDQSQRLTRTLDLLGSEHLPLTNLIASHMLSLPPSEVTGSLLADSHKDSTSSNEAIIYIIALQLLASTYTPAPTPACLPAALYLNSAAGLNPEMMSALRMHSTITAHQPHSAAGHHNRSSSPAPAWPGLLERDREEILADEITRRRLMSKKLRLDGAASETSLAQEHLAGGPLQAPLFYYPDQPRPYMDLVTSHPKRSFIRHQRPELHSYPSPPPSPSPMLQRIRHTDKFELHPIIRSEPHPVYVQPVKELAIKRKKWAFAGMNRWERLRERDRLLGIRRRSSGMRSRGGSGDIGRSEVVFGSAT
jgi:hypothetical protein